MRRISIAVVSLWAAVAAAQPQPAERVMLPAYQTVPGLDRYADKATYEAAAADARFVMEKVEYPSGTLSVHAYVYRPTQSGGRMPVVVFNRGSWTWPSFAAEMLPMAHRLAEKGYVVIAPWYRGSGGDAGRDEMGGADLDDLFNLVPMIGKLPYADPARLFLYGESRGGMMVYQALRDGFPARAAAVYGGFTDLDAMLDEPRWAEAGAQIWPDLATNRAAIAERRSALRWPERIGRPILIMHGGADKAVSPDQSRRMAEALTSAGKTFDLWIPEGEGHLLGGKAEERDARAAKWFAAH